MDWKVFLRVARLSRQVLCAAVLIFSATTFGQTPAAEPDPQILPWIGPEGQSLPFQSPEEIEEFLATARVVTLEGIDQGVTKPRKVSLEAAGIKMNAIFRDIDDFKRRWDNSPYGVQMDFHDYCVYEYVAYRLSRLLGIPNIPPTVRRTFQRSDFPTARDFSKLRKVEGTLQAWVESAMTEKDRLADGTRPPDMRRWANQHHLMLLWDNLVYNMDRNQGNVLIGADWKIWFIDQTRAFRPFRTLRDPEQVRKCDRNVWRRLREVEDSTIEAEVGDLLRPAVLRGLLERRRLLIARLESLIERDGEEVVLFDLY